MRVSDPFCDRGIRMNDPTHAPSAIPEPAPAEVRTSDPLAVALGNASLLGVGYLMVRRRRWLAVAALAVTLVLVVRLGVGASPSDEVVMLLWWVAVTAHGWFLARRRAPRGTRLGQRLVALGVMLPVLLTVAYLRVEAAGIERSVSEARERGDCAEVARAQGWVSFGHRVVDARSTADGDEVVRMCDRVRLAGGELDIALVGDLAALRRGFRTLDSVLASPGNEKTVEVTLAEFLGDLPTADSCATVTVIDWLRDRKLGDDLLDRTAAAADRSAPASLVGCGDDLMWQNRWKDAREQYERVLDQYPGDDLAGRARKGVTKATRNIERDTIRDLLAPVDGDQPKYCSKPAEYSGAEPMGKGPNRALYFGAYDGADEYSDKLPGSWRADNAEDAALVVCMGNEGYGDPVRTCPYVTDSGSTTYVRFHKIEIPVKVYELRTGKLVSDREIQINGSSCPAIITYYEYGYDDSDPPQDDSVEVSKSDIRDAFRPLVVR